MGITQLEQIDINRQESPGDKKGAMKSGENGQKPEVHNWEAKHLAQL